jgi:Uma2 family endonuclease
MIPRQRSWTRDEYYRLADLGFFTDQRVELIEGQIIDMGPMNSAHATAIALAQATLEPAFGPSFFARIQMPFHVGVLSEPEPDVAIVAGPRRAYTTAHPTTAALIVEVADSSLAYDRDAKASLYAKAGIADYWLINLTDRQVEIYRGAAPDSAAFIGWRYTERRVAGVGETVSPLMVPAATIAVSDLLP